MDTLLTLQTCILIFWLLAQSASATSVRNDPMPSFKKPALTRQASSYYLAEGEDWVPNGITQIVVLMAQQPLPVRVALSGSEAGLKSVSLLYKCSSTESTFSEAPLDTSVLPSSHCSRLRPFTVKIVSAANYRLSLLTENQVPFDQALRHSLELRLRVSFHEGVLESASLFIFNFDALSKIPPQIEAIGSIPPKARPGHFDYLSVDPCPGNCNQSKRQIEKLTAVESFWYFYMQSFEAIQWSSAGNVGKIQVFRKELVDAINQADPMVRALLSMTLFYSKNCSNYSEPTAVLVRYGSEVEEYTGRRSLTNHSFEHLLDINTGTMYLTYSSFYALAKKLPSHSGALDVCLNVSVIGQLWSYTRSFQLQKSENFSLFSGAVGRLSSFEKTYSTRTCYQPRNAYHSKIELPANFYNLSLACPFVCSGAVVALKSFIGSHCSNSGSIGSARRPPCSRFYDTSSKSCQINLLGPTSIMHNGNYTVFASGLVYTYQVTVVSLPIFTPEAINHDTKVFSLRMGPVTMSCSVMHSDISQVELTPRFCLQEKFKVGGRWQLVEPREFGAMVLDGDPHGVSVTTIRSATRTEVVVRLSSQKGEDWWQLWKAAFECSASASPEDAQRFGLPEFKLDASWSLVPRPSFSIGYASSADSKRCLIALPLALLTCLAFVTA